MTKAEATETLALWKRCPDCAVPGMEWQQDGAPGWSLAGGGSDGVGYSRVELLLDDDHAASIICGALERWLFKTIGACQIEMYPDGMRVCSITTYTHHRLYTRMRPTKLLALVSACNTVLDGMDAAACDDRSSDLRQGEMK